MGARITKQQFNNRIEWVTGMARECGAIANTDTISTAIAWSMSYVCVYDVNGEMVRSLSQPMNTRQLFDYMGAMSTAFEMVIRVQREKATR